MSRPDANAGAVGADLLARRNTRLPLGALSEMTGFTPLVGELVLDQVPHAIERTAAKRGNADTLLQAFELWRREAIDQGVVRIVDAAQVRTHRLEHPVHRWVERTWEALRGDPTDIEHVSVALAGGGDVVLTSNGGMRWSRGWASRVTRHTVATSVVAAVAAGVAPDDVPRGRTHRVRAPECGRRRASPRCGAVSRHARGSRRRQPGRGGLGVGPDRQTGIRWTWTDDGSGCTALTRRRARGHAERSLDTGRVGAMTPLSPG